MIPGVVEVLVGAIVSLVIGLVTYSIRRLENKMETYEKESRELVTRHEINEKLYQGREDTARRINDKLEVINIRHSQLKEDIVEIKEILKNAQL